MDRDTLLKEWNRRIDELNRTKDVKMRKAILNRIKTIQKEVK